MRLHNLLVLVRHRICADSLEMLVIVLDVRIAQLLLSRCLGEWHSTVFWESSSSVCQVGRSEVIELVCWIVGFISGGIQLSILSIT